MIKSLFKVYVCRPVVVRKEFTKAMPPGNPTYYNRAVPDKVPSGAWTEAVQSPDRDNAVAGQF